MEAILLRSAKLNTTGCASQAHMAKRLAATLARCIIHCVPTSIAGEWSFALADMRHMGRLATVKAMASPDATIQAVATNRIACLDSVSRHASDVKKLLPAGRDNRHAVALQRLTQVSDAQPWDDQLGRDMINLHGCIQRIPR